MTLTVQDVNVILDVFRTMYRDSAEAWTAQELTAADAVYDKLRRLLAELKEAK